MALIKGESEEVWQCLGWDGNEEPCPGYVRGENTMKFKDNAAVREAMRYFSNASLAKIVLHNPEIKDTLKRHMSRFCWNMVQEYLDDYDFAESPEEAFNRFEKKYQIAEKDNTP
jgi:hypothetical protein